MAIIMEGPNGSGGTWVHWILFNLPPTPRGLPENRPTTLELSNGADQGTNSWGKIGYGGPCPPKGQVHTYQFTVYALDSALTLPAGATFDQLQSALQGGVLAQGALTGTYAGIYIRTSDDEGDSGGGGGGGY